MRAIILYWALIADCKMYMSCDDNKCKIHTCADCPDGYSIEETELGKLCFKYYAEKVNFKDAKYKLYKN